MRKSTMYSASPLAAENDADFDAFVSSIAVSPEVLRAMITMPAHTIVEVQRHLREDDGVRRSKGRPAMTQRVALTRAALR